MIWAAVMAGKGGWRVREICFLTDCEGKINQEHYGEIFGFKHWVDGGTNTGKGNKGEALLKYGFVKRRQLDFEMERIQRCQGCNESKHQ
jgi:hypothetical protein